MGLLFGRYCEAKRREIEYLQVEHGRRPFGAWHGKCYYVVLAKTVSLLREKGITLETVIASCPGDAVRAGRNKQLDSLQKQRRT